MSVADPTYTSSGPLSQAALEAPDWTCPVCARQFHRRFLTEEEVVREYGVGLSFEIFVDGHDARVEHLDAHARSGPASPESNPAGEGHVRRRRADIAPPLPLPGPLPPPEARARRLRAEAARDYEFLRYASALAKYVCIYPNYGDDFEVNQRLGWLYFNSPKAEFQKAIPYLRKAHRLDPKSVDVIHNLAKATCSARLFDESLGFYEKLVRLDPNMRNRWSGARARLVLGCISSRNKELR